MQGQHKSQPVVWSEFRLKTFEDRYGDTITKLSFTLVLQRYLKDTNIQVCR